MFQNIADKKLYIFIIFAVCTAANTEKDSTGEACVCSANFYQTNAANTDEVPVCTACPLGSTTQSAGNTDISACGMNSKNYHSIRLTLVIYFHRNVT